MYLSLRTSIIAPKILFRGRLEEKRIFRKYPREKLEEFLKIFQLKKKSKEESQKIKKKKRKEESQKMKKKKRKKESQKKKLRRRSGLHITVEEEEIHHLL